MRSRWIVRMAVMLAGLGVASGLASAAAEAPAPPGVRSLPSIVGTAMEGETLVARNGEWTGARPMSFSYQWRRCARTGRNCADIGGATGQTYNTVAADVRRTLRIRVTARNRDGSASALSGATAVIRPRRVTPPPPAGPAGQVRLGDGKISIPVTSVSLPNRLIVSEVAFSSSPVRSRRPFTASFRVTDTRGYVVRDAVVFVLGVPYSRILPVAEQATGMDGYVHFSLQPTARLPLRRGYYLVLFVRARKAGENLLAGISTRRLVQVRLDAQR